ncbi:metallophosphoesterase [Salipiger aestuarii]|uniref:Serine/threonine protein phosphatase 1 n=1 Tax=Salipiger aestuarii TaxID=568098 RepID=A0A327YSN3_9RHOB|nr:metallophosphoesterase [Salipiger aestuarii]EIE51169.1 metallophosphoesterase [Citreicella sp. 357]RAK23933.1 serine/threonine protein phosphatase 1 [Salipiger aestuarii]
MRRFLRRKPLGGAGIRRQAFQAPIQPLAPFWAIGDLHGCAELFDRLLDQMFDLGRPAIRLVLMGDYIDRGDDSAGVLRRLHGIQTEVGVDVMVCLRGNHDQMLIDFLDRPELCGPRWLRHGGLQTLASFGVAAPRPNVGHAQWQDARDRLRGALGDATEAWLRGLPSSWQSGNVFACHAGTDPALPVGAQDEAVLLWGHPDFERISRGDDTWVVHGHTIVKAPQAQDGRISIDTGAYATGRLSAALIEPGHVTFVST